MAATTSVQNRSESAGTYWSPDQWFAALDQRQIGIGVQAWTAQVLGVHADGPDLWMQVASNREPYATVILRVSPGTSVEEVVRVLERSSRSGEGPEIIDLAIWHRTRVSRFREAGK
jgi:hypothetical protein